MKRAVWVLFAVLGSAVACASPASAGVQTDYGLTCTLTVTPPQVTAGTQAVVAGQGFQPNLTTQLILDDGTAGEAILADVVTDNLGNFSTTVTIPATTPPGAHVIFAVCDGTTGAGADTAVTVLSSTQTTQTTPASTTTLQASATTLQASPTTLQAAPSSTARTGTDVAPQVAAGIAILGAGAAIVLISRRRQQAAAP